MTRNKRTRPPGPGSHVGRATDNMNDTAPVWDAERVAYAMRVAAYVCDDLAQLAEMLPDGPLRRDIERISERLAAEP